MKIGELARLTGLAPSTIRFYESKGLMSSVDRRANGYRDYPQESVALLHIIINAQQTGFTLEEIKDILPANPADWRHDELMAALHRKLEEIASMERRLAQNRMHLLSLIEMIEAKPKDMDCRDNAVRVIDNVGSRNFKKDGGS